MLANQTGNRVFGKRSQQHILILASGDKVRHMTIRPWAAALTFCFVGVFTIGYLAATSYLVLRDDLIGATMARQARMQHDYEDRIAALRAQVDRVTSRQLLDQQIVEEKVARLLEQQVALSSRHGKLDTILERAEDSGLKPMEIPVPAFNPERTEKRAALTGGANAIEALLAGGERAVAKTATSQTAGKAALAYAPLRESMADRADRVFSTVTKSLKNIEQEQLSRIQGLTINAEETANAIASILNRTGIKVTDTVAESDGNAVGGPFVEPQMNETFETSLNELDAALSRLENVRQTAIELPFGNPAPNREITSRFGNRVDPFLGRLALHAGIDFRSETGAEVRSAGTGKVTNAGPSGGYGNMVEIDHGQGITTRYGHLSRVLVNEGQQIQAGDIIGRAGSTGRSTGPHLHYEVRRNGSAVDPMRFISAGSKLSAYLN